MEESDMKYTLKKVLEEHKNADSPFYNTMLDMLSAGGFEGLLSSLTGSRFLGTTYPDLLFDNGLLNVTKTDNTVGANEWFYRAVTLNYYSKLPFTCSFQVTQANNIPTSWFIFYGTDSAFGNNGVGSVFSGIDTPNSITGNAILFRTLGDHISITGGGVRTYLGSTPPFVVNDPTQIFTIQEMSPGVIKFGVGSSIVSVVDFPALTLTNTRYIGFAFKGGAPINVVNVVSMVPTP